MKLKNKIFLIFILFALLFFAFNFNSIVFGANNITFSGHCDNVDYTVPNFYFPDTEYDFNNGYIIYKVNDVIKMSIYATSDGYCYNDGSTKMIVSAVSLHNFDLDTNSNEWVYTDTKVKGEYNYTWVKWSNVLYFSKDIYSNGDCSSIYQAGRGSFFQLPVTGVEIPALETAEQIPEAMATTLKILIPVGLIVLGIGLVIYLIKRVIYLSH